MQHWILNPARILIALGILFNIGPLIAEEANQNYTQAPNLQKPVPYLDSVEEPKKVCSIDEEILYKVRVRWSDQTEDVQMSSPEMVLENLELLKIGEESISGTEEQLLTLRFKAIKPGAAYIRSAKLRWTQAQGTIRSDLKIPAQQLEIKPSRKHLWKWFVLAAGILVLLAIGVAVTSLYFKSRKTIQQTPDQSVEEIQLEKLEDLKNRMDSMDPVLFVNHMSQHLEKYLVQKFNWNRSNDAVGFLFQKVEAVYSKKEARDLKEIFDKLEYTRYSGTHLTKENLNTIYHDLYSFMERKKVIT